MYSGQSHYVMKQSPELKVRAFIRLRVSEALASCESRSAVPQSRHIHLFRHYLAGGTVTVVVLCKSDIHRP